MKNILLLLLLFPFMLFAKEATVTQLFSVQTIKVKQEKTAHTRKNYGYVKADDSRVYEVNPRFGGYVTKLYANKIYNYVHKGDALVTLYSPEVFKAKEDYLNSYRYSQARKNNGMLKSSKLKLELLGVSPKEIQELIKTKKVSKNTTIYAPMSGYIFVKNINDGSAFNAKDNLFKIVNLEKVWVEMKIFDEDLEWIKNSNIFHVHIKSSTTTYKTSSSLLYPNLDPKDATLTLRLHLNNSDKKLFPGMYANITSIETQKQYLTLPRSALIRKNGAYYVFMVGDFKGEYEPRKVQAQILNNNTYIITDGLHKGDEVVNNALFMIDSDAQIHDLY